MFFIHSYCRCFLPRTLQFFRLRMAASSAIASTFNDITKADKDTRHYRGLRLQNGLKLMLISDPETDKSAAAMNVGIGSLSEPQELPGLAHFLEHMLFMGSEKFPDENEYDKYLSEHGGSCNAYTSEEDTNFFFDVGCESLSGALDCFAQFFIAPNFSVSATDREVKAVHSEHEKNLQTDSWRIRQLQKALADRDHPYHGFGSGNLESLVVEPKRLGIDVRSALLEFHKTFYSSNLMSFTILGKETLDELSNMVVPLFSDVKNLDIPLPCWEQHPYGEKQVQRIVRVVPIKDHNSVSLSFPIPDLHEHYKSKPGSYLSHLIGHEGKGSLLTELKSRGWVTALSAGASTEAKGFAFFSVDVECTTEGVGHYEDIIEMMFQYIEMLRLEEPKEWIFNECRDISNMAFQFKGKETPIGYVHRVANLMRRYELDECLAAPYLFEDFKPTLISDLLKLLVPRNCIVCLVGQCFEDVCISTEKWYGTKYSVEDLPSSLLQRISSAQLNSKFSLPPPNEFIATDFSILPREADNEKPPQIMKNTSFVRLWYKQDEKFLFPKAFCSFQFFCPLTRVSPYHLNMCHMLAGLFNDELQEYTYDADIAGLNYNFATSTYGMMLKVAGYNQKLNVLLGKLMNKLTKFKIKPDRFNVIQEEHVRNLKNFFTNQPYALSQYYESMVLDELSWSIDELLEVAPRLTVEELQSFIPQLFGSMFIEGFVYGNVTKAIAKEWIDSVEQQLQENLSAKPIFSTEHRRFRQVQLVDGCSYELSRETEYRPVNSIIIYFQIGVEDTHNNMLLELLAQLIREKCFDTLRTKHQLGYIVFSGAKRLYGAQGLEFLVQSSYPLAYVEKCIEDFISNVSGEIESMEQSEFETHVEALTTRRKVKPKQMKAQNGKYSGEIFSGMYHFNRDDVEVDHLQTISKQQILDFIHQFVCSGASNRRKFVVTVNSSMTDREAPPSEGLQLFVDDDRVQVTDLAMFKRGLGLLPFPPPCSELGQAADLTKAKL